MLSNWRGGRKLAGKIASDGDFSLDFVNTSQGVASGNAGKLSEGDFTWSALEVAGGAVQVTITQGTNIIDAVLVGEELIVDAQ